MKKHKAKIILGLFLITSSIILYLAHYLIFRDAHHLLIFLAGDIAFIPLEVFLVSLVFERIIEIQNVKQVKKKLFMLVEVFFLENNFLELSLRIISEGNKSALNKTGLYFVSNPL